MEMECWVSCWNCIHAFFDWLILCNCFFFPSMFVFAKCVSNSINTRHTLYHEQTCVRSFTQHQSDTLCDLLLSSPPYWNVCNAPLLLFSPLFSPLLTTTCTASKLPICLVSIMFSFHPDSSFLHESLSALNPIKLHLYKIKAGHIE